MRRSLAHVDDPEGQPLAVIQLKRQLLILELERLFTVQLDPGADCEWTRRFEPRRQGDGIATFSWQDGAIGAVDSSDSSELLPWFHVDASERGNHTSIREPPPTGG